MTTSESRVVVDWSNADYFEVSRYLENRFNHQFGGSGFLVGANGGDVSFWVKESSLKLFMSCLRKEMEELKNIYGNLSYTIQITENANVH